MREKVVKEPLPFIKMRNALLLAYKKGKVTKTELRGVVKSSAINTWLNRLFLGCGFMVPEKGEKHGRTVTYYKLTENGRWFAEFLSKENVFKALRIVLSGELDEDE